MEISGKDRPVAWLNTAEPVEYTAAVAFMEHRVAEIFAGNAPDTVWLVTHPALYTAGTSADPAELLSPDRFPVYASGRGGRYTYHGPGQRVAYVMLDLKQRGNDVRAHVRALEDWVIAALACLGVVGERRSERIGIWVDRSNHGGPNRHDEASEREDKIAAIGVRVRRWVTYHGIAINVDPNLEHFDGIIPCGIEGYGVTSLTDLGIKAGMADIDAPLRATFPGVFGRRIGPSDDIIPTHDQGET